MSKCNFRFLMYFLFLIIPLFLLPTKTFAGTEVDSVIDIGAGQGAVVGICEQANRSVGKNILLYKVVSVKDANGSNVNKGLLSFSNKLYSELSMDEKRTFMETALLATKESALGTQVCNKVYNFIANQDSTVSASIKYLKSDVSADFVTAKSWFKPFSGVIGTILGVLSLSIFIFLSLSTVFDLAYLGLPLFKAILERGEPTKKPFGVSREAWSTSKDIEKSSEYENPISLYFKRRIGVVIAISIALGYIISGQIYDLMAYFVDAFSAVFRV